MLERARRRYILVEIDSEEEINRKDFQNAVWSSIIRLFGEYGASKVEMTLIEHDQKERRAILRCSHKELSVVRAAIAAVTSINGKEAAVHVIIVSGTLRALRKKTGEILMREKAKSNVENAS